MITRRLRWWLTWAAVLTVSVTGSILALLGADYYLRNKHAGGQTLNVWGYRSPTVDHKQDSELRIVVLGGSTAFGYGVDHEETIPSLLEGLLAGPVRPEFETTSVVNLAYNALGAFAFRFILEDYEWLEYDLLILYTGYNDLKDPGDNLNLSLFRRKSPVFRLTGYMPILPVLLREKSFQFLYGNVGAGYSEDAQQVAFRHAPVQRGTGKQSTSSSR